MGPTGEECIHQSRHRIYVDGDGDLLFDARMPVYCRALTREVYPTTQCGTICKHFQPISGTDYTPSARLFNPSRTVHLPRDPTESRRALLDAHLGMVCHEIDEAASYLEGQIERRERLWRESDAWLTRGDTRTEVLEAAVTQARSRLANAQAELRRIEARLQAVRVGKASADHLETLWIGKEEQTQKIQQAQDAYRDAEARHAERSRKEDEQNRLYTNWEDALERVPLLRQLRSELERVVRVILEPHSAKVEDALYRRVLEFLNQTRDYASDDVALSNLRTAVDQLTKLAR